MSTRSGLWLAIGLTVGLTAVSCSCRTLLPFDETRYTAVAWEMRVRGDYLVPHLNGETYSHKPPLLFWLINAGWSVAGVTEHVPRLISPLAGLICLLLTWKLARRLWPDDQQTAGYAAVMLSTCLLWMVLSNFVMFDVLLAVFVLIGIHGVWLTADRPVSSLGLIALAVGGGVLTKGPVILLHLLPTALTLPWWFPVRERRQRLIHAGVVGGGCLAGLLSAGCWAIPAAWVGGDEYRQQILWGQTAGRMVNSFAHALPWWWYLPLIPAMFFPWSLLISLLRDWKPSIREDRGVRLCTVWYLSTVAAFSAMSGKQVHYLLPAFPAVALLFSRLVRIQPQLRFTTDRRLVGLALVGTAVAFAFPDLFGNVRFQDVTPRAQWSFVATLGGMAAAIVLFRFRSQQQELLGFAAVVAAGFVVFYGGPLRDLQSRDETKLLAAELAQAEAANIPVAYFGEYHGQFHFAGRLTKPLAVLRGAAELGAWSHQHPEGLVVRSQPADSPAEITPVAAHLMSCLGRNLRVELVPSTDLQMWSADLPPQTAEGPREQHY